MTVVRHDTLLTIRVDRATRDAVSRAAAAQGLKAADWLRSAISTLLSVEGHLPYIMQEAAPGDEAT